MEKTCEHNASVVCRGGNCQNCGWHPLEAHQRKRKIETEGVGRGEDGKFRLTFKRKRSNQN